MKNTSCARASALLLTGLLLCQAATAATVTWSGLGPNDNWSTTANWTGGAPADNAVSFIDDDATGVSGPYGTPNNLVDSSVTVQSLRYGNTNGFHTTSIPSGATLNVASTASPIVFVGTGTDNGGVQTAYATLLGQGSLFVTNTSAAFVVIQGSASSGAKQATLDMEGLDTFTAYVSQIRVAAENGGSSTAWYNRPSATLILAKTNFIYAAGNPGLLFSRTSGNGGPAVVKLGQTNTVFSDSGMNVGERKSTSGTILNFNPMFFQPAALFRNLAGTGRQNLWSIGDQNLQNSGSTGASGQVDFSNGSVDALVNTIIVGRGAASPGTGVGTGTLTFDTGTVDVNTLDIGVTQGGTGNGTVTVNGTASLVVNNVLRLTPAGGGSQATLNMTGGSLRANSITNGGGATANMTLYGATLAITNNAGSLTSPILNLSIGDSAIYLPVTPGATNVFVTTLSTASTTNNTLKITSMPAIAGYPLQYPLISYASYAPLGAADFVPAFPAAATPYAGYISNNVAQNTLDLVITSGPAPARNLTWNGNVNGDWNTGIANWRFGASSSTYNPGDMVAFTDAATGTTTVNLTTTLSPFSLLVNNSARNYTFGGLGSLDGGLALVKQGSGTLILANSGTNTFSGGASIEGGTLQLSGSNNRVPTNASVAILNTGGATLDLNGFNQEIATLAGGDAAAGAVTLGSGTLTINAGGGDFAGTISGSGMLTKSGTGTQVLSGANTYNGGTLVIGGRLTVANTSGSGVGSGLVRVETNATFALGNGSASGSIAATAITNNGTVVLDRSDDLTLNTLIEGDGGLTKNNTNIVTLATANTYKGNTSIGAGALRVSHPAALGSAAGPTTIQNDPTARLELIGGVTLLEPLSISQKQTAAGYVPGVWNVSGTNVLAGPIELPPGGSHWIIHSESGRLIVSGPVTNTTTSNIRNLWLSGPGDGEWNSGLKNGSGTATASIRKDGTGTWSLGGTYTHTSTTTVSNGTLLVQGEILGGTVNVYGGTLGGTGSIAVPVAVYAGGTLAPGSSIGKLAVNNNLTLEGATLMELAKSGGTVTHDQVAVSGTLSLGGSLEVTLSGTLTGGETFQLFTAGTFQGAFAPVNLPVLPSGLSWNTDALATAGVLSVSGGAPVLSITQNGAQLTFAWAGTGYKLQAQTNTLAAGLSAIWHDYPGGASSGVMLTINQANPAVFFRLISQ